MNNKYTKEELDAMRKVFLHNEITDDVTPNLIKFFNNTRFRDFDKLSSIYRNATRDELDTLMHGENLTKEDIDKFFNFLNSEKYNMLYNALKNIKNTEKNVNTKINLAVDYDGIYSYEMMSYMLECGQIKYSNDESGYYTVLSQLKSGVNVCMKRFKFFEFITYCEETIKTIFGNHFLFNDFYTDTLCVTSEFNLKVDFSIHFSLNLDNDDILKKALYHCSISLGFFEKLCDAMNAFIIETERGLNFFNTISSLMNKDQYNFFNKIFSFTITRMREVEKIVNCDVCIESGVGVLFYIYAFSRCLKEHIAEIKKTYLDYLDAKKKKKNNKRREVYKIKRKTKIENAENVEPEYSNVIVSEPYIETDDSLLTDATDSLSDELTDETEHSYAESVTDKTDSLTDETEHSCAESVTNDDNNDVGDEMSDDEEPINHIVIHDKNTNHLIFNRYVFINCVCKIRYSEKRLLRTCLNMYFDTNEKYQNFIRINQIERIDIVKPLHKGFTDGEHFNVIFVSLVNPKLNLTVFHVYLDYDCDGNMYLTTMTCIYNPFD